LILCHLNQFVDDDNCEDDADDVAGLTVQSTLEGMYAYALASALTICLLAETIND